MTLTAMPLAAFDLETTSADPLTARIVTASIINIGSDGPTAEEWLLDPGITIPQPATDVHGITTAHAQEHGAPYPLGYAGIRDRLETLWAQDHAVAVMNAAFDLTIIDREGTRLGFPPLEVGVVVDPFVVDRQLDKYRRGKRTLTALCEHYGLRQDDAHQATGDAIAAARLAWKLIRHPTIQDLTPEDLMAAQAAWHRERQQDFIAYRQRTQQPTDNINCDWPIQGRAS